MGHFVTAVLPWARRNTGWSSTGGAGRVGSVAAEQKGGKAKERPVIILTKQKGSGVSSAFKKKL